MTAYLEPEDVLEYLERAGLTCRDLGLLDSAIHRPRTSRFGRDAQSSLELKVAALVHSVSQNQALADGNKRLALLCGHAFLALNGHELGASDDGLFDLFIEMADGLADLAQIAPRLGVRPREGEGEWAL